MISKRDRPSYPSDPGTGVTLARTGDFLRVGMTWDGAERGAARFTLEEVKALLEGRPSEDFPEEGQLVSVYRGGEPPADLPDDWVGNDPDPICPLHAENERLREALDGLHESLFIGSERGLSKETLRSMAAYAKAALS